MSNIFKMSQMLPKKVIFKEGQECTDLEKFPCLLNPKRPSKAFECGLSLCSFLSETAYCRTQSFSSQ